MLASAAAMSAAAMSTAADARSSGGGPARPRLSLRDGGADLRWRTTSPGQEAGAPVAGHLIVAVRRAEPPVAIFIKSSHHPLEPSRRHRPPSRAASELSLKFPSPFSPQPPGRQGHMNDGCTRPRRRRWRDCAWPADSGGSPCVCGGAGPRRSPGGAVRGDPGLGVLWRRREEGGERKGAANAWGGERRRICASPLVGQAKWIACLRLPLESVF